MRFSDLTNEFPDSTNRLYTRLEELRHRRIEVVDLVRGRADDIGIGFPQEMLNAILSDASGLAREYRPDPLGQPAARNAIAKHYSNSALTPEHTLLTPGTSISYWYAFKLLCKPGDNVLCPAPSYPLFDYIARLAGVEISKYRLVEGLEWQIDLEHLEDQIDERTRAIVLISPHNPTGMVATRDEVEAIAALASRKQLPIISDEVFWDFTFDETPAARPFETDAPLVFTLNGFSKMYALPGLKLGWMAVSGKDPLVRKAMTTLELISDTFLPVNEMVQFSVPEIFAKGTTFLKDYTERVRQCRDITIEALGPAVGTPPDGGFYMVVPCSPEEEGMAIALLEEETLLVHPGYFYDIPGNHLVFSFLKDPEVLRAVVPRIRRRLG